MWAYPPAPNNVVRAIVEFQGEAYIGGGFTNLGYMLTRWDGSSYVPLSQPLAWAGGGVSSLAVYDGFGGPALYVGGGSFQLSGVPFPTTHYGVVRWNGSSWSGTGFPNSVVVTEMVGYDDGQGPALYAATPSHTPYLRRWDGNAWAAVLDAPRARTLVVFDDGEGPALYAGGQFLSNGSLPMKNLAKYRQGVWSEVGGGLSFASGGSLPFVSCLEVLDLGDGPRLFAGGAFTRAGTLPVQFIASWDGAAWTGYRFGSGTFMSSYPTITSLAVLRNSDPPLLLAGGGSFQAGNEIRGLMAWDGERWYSAGASIPGYVYALLPREELGSSGVLVAGTQNWVAEWTPSPVCYANCDCSSASPLLNAADFTCFLQRFAAGDFWANCDLSTTQPALNVADFTCFLQRFAAGCD